MNRFELWVFLINFIVRGVRLFTGTGPVTSEAPARPRGKVASLSLQLMRAWFAPPSTQMAHAVLSAARLTAAKDVGLLAYPVATVTTIWKGGMVCVNASGYAVPAADTSGLSNVVGVAYETVVNSGANGALSVRVECGKVFDFAATSITQAMVGTEMFVADDQTFDNTSSNGIRAGVLVGFVSTTRGWLAIREPATNPGTIGASDLGTASVTAAKLSATLIKGFIPLPLTGFRLIAANDIAAKNAADGGLISLDTDPTLKRVNAATDKQLRIAWAAASVIEITTQFAYPPDLDDAAIVSVHLLMGMGGGADTPVIAVSYWEGVGDANAGGNTAALAAGVADKSVNIAAADIGAYPKAATVGLIPAAHATDAIFLYAAWIEYQRA